jgi:hypothetical protein
MLLLNVVIICGNYFIGVLPCPMNRSRLYASTVSTHQSDECFEPRGICGNDRLALVGDDNKKPDPDEGLTEVWIDTELASQGAVRQ